MTDKELKAIENELQKRGYRKWTVCLTSEESYGWFKTFGSEVNGYQIAFRVWDFCKYQDREPSLRQYPYGFDFWTSPLGSDFRTDLTSNWEPICDLDTFERMAAEFNQMIREFVKE